MTTLQRALRAVTIFSCAVIFMRLVEVIILLKAYPLVLGVSGGSAVPVEEIGALVSQSKRLTIVWCVVVLAWFASIVAFTSVAYGALRAEAVPRLRFGPLSVALLYLVPLWNVLHSLLTLQELFRASQHDPKKAHLFDWHDEDSSTPINVAWILGVGALLFDGTARVFAIRTPSTDVFLVAFTMRIGASLMAAVALLSYRNAMAGITERIELMAAKREFSGTMPVESAVRAS